ncbi:MAG: aspartate kinase [Armatimonadetes bacterium]|nr:aspartate kinase [Armatimonadota bacterium]
MSIVVQKFGGTSVATPDGRRRAAERVIQALSEGVAPVVVLSAMGRAPAPYATDSLLALVAEFRECRNPRELDMLMACGEIISCVVFSHYLRSLGYPSQAFDAYRAGILTSDDPGEARILTVEPARIHESLRKGEIPVVAGFQGVDGNLSITTLGRGGSDTTAVALGAALRASYVEIYTDVDGVMTTDPRIYPQARVLSEVTFQELGELAEEGAKVVHPRAVALASEYDVTVWIRNTFSDAYGTLLSRITPKAAFEKVRVVSGVAHVVGLSYFAVDGAPGADSKARADIFREIAVAGIPLDLINVCGRGLYFIVRSEREPATREVLERLGHPFQVRSGCAKVSVIGAGMRGTPGVMSRVMGALVRGGVEVLHSTDSHITISCLIPEEQLRSAVAAVHDEFQL